MTELKRLCCVCGATLPYFPAEEMIRKGCAVRRGDGQILFFCINRHTDDEIVSAVWGLPRFHTAGEIPRTVIDPCQSCQYQKQACAYILNGKNPEDACPGKRIWLK